MVGERLLETISLLPFSLGKFEWRS
nr:unnamed protein product [Callosobruchus chinensis]